MSWHNCECKFDLSRKQVDNYERDGFIVLPGLFTGGEVREMQQAAEELSNEVGPIIGDNPRLQVDPIGGGFRIRQVWPVIDVSPYFATLAANPAILQVMRTLFGEEPELFEDKLNYKYPRGGTAFSMHQDYAYWENYSPSLSTVLIYLDESTDENGCLQVLPGLQKSGLFPHRRLTGPKSDLTMEAPDESIPRVKVRGPAGTAVVFSCWTPHASGPNLSNNPQRAFILSYNPRSDGSSYQANAGDVLRKSTDWLRGQTAEARPANS